MTVNNTEKEMINDLIQSNIKYKTTCKEELEKFRSGQNPRIAVLSCSDSRVIPEKIFDKSLGDLFVVRVAGNVAIGKSIISSLEYAVEHLHVKLLIILGHTNCGAVIAAEQSSDETNELLNEIRQSFHFDKNHSLSNIIHQRDMLPKRSTIISKAIEEEKLFLRGAMYHLEDGTVSFL